MNSDDLLKLWATIETLPERKARLALFGLVIQRFGEADERFEGVSAEALVEAKQLLKERGAL